VSRYTMKAECKHFNGLAGVEIAVINGITDDMAALAIYSGAANLQTYLTADELTALIENLTAAREELIRGEFSFPAIEVIEVEA